MELNSFKQTIKNKKIGVVGVGVSNVPLIELLADGAADITAYDKKNSDELGDIYDKLTRLGVKFVLGEDYLSGIEGETDILFKTPGLRFDIPALIQAAERGTIITSEMELFFETCPCPIIAVTGSDGKTTTTTLISEMLKREGFNCHIGGNIGRPLIGDLNIIQSRDIAVVELSSFQLQTMKQSPHIGVVTNVTPNHLDWHTDMEEYISAKSAVYKFQNEDDKIVLNYDNPISRSFAGRGKSETVFFSRENRLENGICLIGDDIVLMKNGGVETCILDRKDIIIPGIHNAENYMAAIAAVWELVSINSMKSVAQTFSGVEHRIELVRMFDGVKYYNDSIASSPARASAGLKSFDRMVILIAGGYDKNIPFDEFGFVVNEHVKSLILVGATSEKIENAVKKAANFKNIQITGYTDFNEAVNGARKVAASGDIVLFSPACASFDMFENFARRGDRFKEIVCGFC